MLYKTDDREINTQNGSQNFNSSDSFIHSFIMHSVNSYKVNQPIGYRACHDKNVIYT